jgi:methyl coenzyme M reductase beta subunit
MPYSDAEIRQYIREVVSETKKTAKVDTGFLKRSIKGALIGKNKSIEFREVFYGAYNNNSKLVENAKRMLPNDIVWTVIFVDEDGNETQIEGKTRTGRKISRKEIGSENISTKNIKALIASIKARGETKDDTRERNRSDDNKTP